jgi:hypothetical protein
MEPDIEPTEDEIKAEPLLQLFRYKHLTKPELRALSRSFTAQAKLIASLPRNPERSASLRKLRESKDAAVTAMLWVG